MIAYLIFTICTKVLPPLFHKQDFHFVCMRDDVVCELLTMLASLSTPGVLIRDLCLRSVPSNQCCNEQQGKSLPMTKRCTQVKLLPIPQQLDCHLRTRIIRKYLHVAHHSHYIRFDIFLYFVIYAVQMLKKTTTKYVFMFIS